MLREAFQPVGNFTDVSSQLTVIEGGRTRPAVTVDFDQTIDVAATDDLSRHVYGVLGVPVDVVDMANVLGIVEASIAERKPLFLSTPNLNFVVTSWFDGEFRETLLMSDLCTADGMAVVWIARLLGVPIKERVAGSDFFEALKSGRTNSRPLSVFLFGGPAGVAELASRKLNSENGGLVSVGAHFPGHGSVDDMAKDEILEAINASRADFLAIALSAKKGQMWLKKSHCRLRVPVRAQVGATVNFQAGTLRRAPVLLRRCGLEWLWRIKEEPYIWRRYFTDGVCATRLFLTRAMPLAAMLKWQRYRWRGQKGAVLSIAERHDDKRVTLQLSGAATTRTLDVAVRRFRDALKQRRNIALDLSGVYAIDLRFIGLALMLRKQLRARGLDLEITRAPHGVRRFLRLSGFAFLATDLVEAAR